MFMHRDDFAVGETFPVTGVVPDDTVSDVSDACDGAGMRRERLHASENSAGENSGEGEL